MVIGQIKNLIDSQKRKLAFQKKKQVQTDQFQETEEVQQAQALKKEADRLAQLKQYKTAIEEYKKSLEVYPYSGKEDQLFENAKQFLFKTHYNIAACHSYLDQFEDAVTFFDNAIAIDIEDDQNKVKALMAKGSSYYRKKLLIEGRYRGGYAIELDTDDKEVNDSTDYAKLAHACFEQATHLDANNLDAWYSKGHMEFLMGKIKDAVVSFDNVINLDKKYQNKENIPLFNEIKKEKGLVISNSDLLPNEEDRAFRTKTGHLVKNKAERSIADFLFTNKLLFCYNTAVTWASKDEFRSTFFIPQFELYIDHFPFDTVKEYKKSMKSKIKEYEKKKKHHIFTTSADEKNLEEALRLKLKPYVML